jgi:hypothetical protein
MKSNETKYGVRIASKSKAADQTLPLSLLVDERTFGLMVRGS